MYKPLFLLNLICLSVVWTLLIYYIYCGKSKEDECQYNMNPITTLTGIACFAVSCIIGINLKEIREYDNIV